MQKSFVSAKVSRGACYASQRRRGGGGRERPGQSRDFCCTAPGNLAPGEDSIRAGWSGLEKCWYRCPHSQRWLAGVEAECTYPVRLGTSALSLRSARTPTTAPPPANPNTAQFARYYPLNTTNTHIHAESPAHPLDDSKLRFSFLSRRSAHTIDDPQGPGVRRRASSLNKPPPPLTMLLPKGSAINWKSARARLPPSRAIWNFLLRTRFLLFVAVAGIIVLIWNGVRGTAGDWQR